MKPARNLQKRSGIYYVRARVNGRYVYQSLCTGDQAVARARARTILDHARGERWGHVEDMKSRRPTATIGDVIDVYRELAARQRSETGKPRALTVTENVSKLLRLVKPYSESDPRAALATVLTREMLQQFVALRLEAGRDNLDRARTSAATVIRGARSVFARWALADMRQRLQLPDLDGFLKCKTVRAPDKKYRFPPPALVDATMKEAGKLEVSKPNLFAVWLLCYYLGMRAKEAACARWSWIREGEAVSVMEIIRRPDFEPKSRDRRVPIGKTVKLRLMALRRPDDDFILPGGSPNGRRDLVTRKFAAWMRSIGWDRATYPKAAHELRKLIGSEWYTRYGVEVAADWLGDTLEVTWKYYADLKRHPDPVEIEG